MDMPEPLRRFFETNEGIGVETSPDRPIRIAKLKEAGPVQWKDMHIIGTYEPPGEWKQFAGWRIGYSDTLDEIVYVIRAPGIREGSVIAMGTTPAGPGGLDRFAPEGSLVLAESFDKWIARLQQHGPDAHGLFPDMELPENIGKEIHDEIIRMNPHSGYARRPKTDQQN